ncbi:hypothetical protein NDU88_005855 [Pleurodeles waltl]|uniref:Uncharacterized protein n=1 Tax=Pleurodeles waltl TaxID=8319 RepID=A0AAV7TVY9_PLEWA|nr:hypothetical protein NDU88_005855 [Pleurodeles waltl]
MPPYAAPSSAPARPHSNRPLGVRPRRLSAVSPQQRATPGFQRAHLSPPPPQVHSRHRLPGAQRSLHATTTSACLSQTPRIHWGRPAEGPLNQASPPGTPTSKSPKGTARLVAGREPRCIHRCKPYRRSTIAGSGVKV